MYEATSKITRINKKNKRKKQACNAIFTGESFARITTYARQTAHPSNHLQKSKEGARNKHAPSLKQESTKVKY